LLYYYLKTAPKENEEVRLEILDAQGQVVRKYSSKKQASQQPEEAREEEEESGEQSESEPLPAEVGLNRFNWDLRYEPSTKITGYSLWAYESGIEGPRVLPGSYQVRLTAGGQTLTAPLEVKLDPRVKAQSEDLKKQLNLALEINHELTRVDQTVNQIRSLRNQLHSLDRELGGTSKDVVSAANGLDQKLTAVEEKLMNPKISASEDSLAYAIQLDGKLASLEAVVESADSAPTEGSRAAYSDLEHQVDEQLTAWDSIRARDLAAFNDLARREKIQVIVVPAGASAEASAK
jgi:hypothetical protein